MNEESVFRLINDLAQKEDILCVLIGGFAINYHKVTRQTVDVDFLITQDGFGKARHLLEQAGYKLELQQENFAQLTSTRPGLMDIDFMFIDQKTLEQIAREGQYAKIANLDFLVPSLDHLIALKLHSIKHNQKNRLARDLPDIINLAKINEIDVLGEAFKTLCLKYGNEDIYQKIVEAF